MTARRRRAAAATVRRRTPVVVPAAIVFPTDAGHVNVKAAPYNAVGDGIADDTAALLAALTDNDYLDVEGDVVHIDRPAARTVYLPAGTYKVTAPLDFPGAGVRLIGAGETATTIKLADNLSAFQTGVNYLLRTGVAGSNLQENSGYGNYVQHLTLDVGSGNPAAVGCRYSVANSGSMRHVTIKSSDPAKAGLRGLMFGTTAGPGYVADLTVDGFATGIYSEGSMVNDIVFTGIVCKNQTGRAIQSNTKTFAFEDLTVTNTPLAIDVTDARASVQVVDATFTGTGSGPAVQLVSGAYLYARDVAATGWTNIVTQAGTARFVGATTLREWGSVNYRRGNTSVAWGESSPYVGLNLPMQRAPEYFNSNLAQWARPQDFVVGGASYTGTGDVGPFLQAAIDSGAKVVYLPYANYSLTSAVIMRGACRRIEGMFSMITRGTGGSFTVGAMADGQAIIENFVPVGGFTVVHDSAATVSVRDVGNRNAYTAPVVETGDNATGDLHVESVGSNARLVVDRPISVWTRQFNRERGSYVISGGATARIFGDNVELQASDVDADATFTDSTVEIIGGAFDVQNYDGYPIAGKAAYAFTNCTASVVMPSALRGTATMGHWVSDTVSGVAVGDVTSANVLNATTGLTDDRVVVQMYVSP